MNKFIALLRGINVSGQKQIKMADLQSLFESINFSEVKTYIQSGNVIFSAKEKDSTKLEKKISFAIKKRFGFEINVIIISSTELKNLINKNPFINKKIDIEKLYVVFLSNSPDKENIKNLNASDFSPEEYFLDDKSIYLFVPNGYGRAKLNNNYFESKLKVPATTRNWRTVRTLFELVSNKNYESQ